MNSIRAEQIGDTVDILSHDKKLFISSADCASLDAVDLTQALIHPNCEAPFASIGENQL